MKLVKVSNDGGNVIGMTWPHDGEEMKVKTLEKVPNDRRTGCSPNLKAKIISKNNIHIQR